SQLRDPPVGTRPGTSTTTAPGAMADSSAEAVSGLALKPSASGGTAPARTRSPAATRPSTARYLPPPRRAGGGGCGNHPVPQPELPGKIILCITFTFMVSRPAHQPGRQSGTLTGRG